MVPRRHDESAPGAPATRRAVTLERLLFIVAIVTALIAGAVPRHSRSRIASNETAAIGTLRTLSTSQSGWQSAAIVDADGDGTGEFGFLVELSGTTSFRTPNGTSVAPTSPAFITSVLGSTALVNGGIAEKSGYCFLVYLPTGSGPALAETGRAMKGRPADANNQEVRFAAYAWPAVLGQTGRRAFVVSQQGEVFATDNMGNQDYEGLAHPPAAGAAMVAGPEEDAANLEGSLVTHVRADDGFVWRPAGN